MGEHNYKKLSRKEAEWLPIALMLATQEQREQREVSAAGFERIEGRNPGDRWNARPLQPIYNWRPVKPTSPANGSKRLTISQPPASRLLALVELLSSKNGLRRAVTESIMDTRVEYFQALQAGDTKGARWIATRGSIAAVWTGIVYLSLRAIVGRLLEAFKLGK